MNRIYLDYNASTPIAPEVATAMQPFLAVPEGIGRGAVRFSLGRGTTREEIDLVLELLRTRLVRTTT